MTTVIVIAAGGLTYHIIKRKSNRKKRRAKRAPNGARVEVVVVAGSPSEPITRSISLDLERRGFIVYIVCNTIEEEVLVQNESRPDIKPLMIDIVDVRPSPSLHLLSDKVLARKRPSIHPPLYSLPASTARRGPRHKTTPSSFPLSDLDTYTKLSFLTNRHARPISSF